MFSGIWVGPRIGLVDSKAGKVIHIVTSKKVFSEKNTSKKKLDFNTNTEGLCMFLIQLYRWFDEFRALSNTKNSRLFRKLARPNEGSEKWRLLLGRTLYMCTQSILFLGSFFLHSNLAPVQLLGFWSTPGDAWNKD
jgi:hypothetical protein